MLGKTGYLRPHIGCFVRRHIILKFYLEVTKIVADLCNLFETFAPVNLITGFRLVLME